MKAVIKIVALSLLFAGVSLSKAAEPITGAFGYKFGDVFDPKSASEAKNSSDGGLLCTVNPPMKNSFFSEYYVIVTPKSHRIYAIWALGEFKDKQEAVKMHNSLKASLEKKYGEARESLTTEEKFVILQSKFSVDGIVAERSDKTGVILLKYMDFKTSDLAKKETQEVADPKLDKSGL